jgi:uncharacterized protein (AIM24 family)
MQHVVKNDPLCTKIATAMLGLSAFSFSAGHSSAAQENGSWDIPIASNSSLNAEQAPEPSTHNTADGNIDASSSPQTTAHATPVQVTKAASKESHVEQESEAQKARRERELLGLQIQYAAYVGIASLVGGYLLIRGFASIQFSRKSSSKTIAAQLANHRKTYNLGSTPVAASGEPVEPTGTDAQRANVRKLEFEIINDSSGPVLKVGLPIGGILISEKGAFRYKEKGIKFLSLASKVLGMSNSTGVIKRLLAGESFFFQTFLNESDGTRTLTLSPSKIGTLIRINLADYEQGLIGDGGSFFAATDEVKLDIIPTGGLKGLFSGLGMYGQKFAGSGNLILFAPGALEEITLKEGEALHCDTDCLFLWEPSVKVSLDNQRLDEAAFSGEGLFLGEISGPGKVWMSSRGVGDDASSNRVGGYWLPSLEWVSKFLNW